MLHLDLVGLKHKKGIVVLYFPNGGGVMLICLIDAGVKYIYFTHMNILPAPILVNNERSLITNRSNMIDIREIHRGAQS